MLSKNSIVAHRGNAYEFPENTIAAYDSAIKNGVKYIELDIQVSEDLTVFASHDPYLLTVDHRLYDIGSTHSGFLKEIFNLETLAEQLRFLSHYPDVTVFVEIKCETVFSNGLHTPYQVVQTIGKVIEEYYKQVVLISFSTHILEMAHRYCCCQNDIRFGLVLVAYRPAGTDGLYEWVNLHAPHYIFIDWKKIPQDDSPLWNGRWKWVSYEVTNWAHAITLNERGIDLIETKQVHQMMNSAT